MYGLTCFHWKAKLSFPLLSHYHSSLHVHSMSSLIGRYVFINSFDAIGGSRILVRGESSDTGSEGAPAGAKPQKISKIFHFFLIFHSKLI